MAYKHRKGFLFPAGGNQDQGYGAVGISLVFWNFGFLEFWNFGFLGKSPLFPRFLKIF